MTIRCCFDKVSNSNSLTKGPGQLLTHCMLMLQTVALSQLDSLRRELIACARDRLEFLVFTKVCKRHLPGLVLLQYLPGGHVAFCRMLCVRS